MNNLHVIARTQHPQLFTQNQPQNRLNRQKIELTQTQNFMHNQQKSNYSTYTTASHIKVNQNDQRHLHQDRSFHSQQHKQNSNFHPQLYLLMKQQIDIAVSNYRQKTCKLLKQQAQKLQKLSAIIIHGNKVIQRQSQIIAGFKNNNQFMMHSRSTRIVPQQNLRSVSKSPTKISLTHKNSTKKISNQREASPLSAQNREKQDVDAKIMSLKQAVEQVDRRLKDSQNQNRQLIKKISDIQKRYQDEVWTKIKVSQQTLKKFILLNQKKWQDIQKNAESFTNFKRQIAGKLGMLQQQSRQLRENIINLNKRQFTYESYQLNNLKEHLYRISQEVNALVSQRCQQVNKKPPLDNNQKDHLKHSYSMNYSQHLPKSRKSNFEPEASGLQRSQFSSLSHYAPKYIKEIEEDRVKRSEQWDLQQNGSALSDSDEFYYDNVQSQVEVRQQKMVKLQQVMKKQGYKFPVKIQIDETGYMKQYLTGMYILDEFDNGFQFTQEELKELKSRGVIVL